VVLVLVDRVYNCSVSPYDDGYLFCVQCKLYFLIIILATMSFFNVFG